MQYSIPEVVIDGELEESLNNIEKVIKDLNSRRDQGLNENLEEKINKHLQISHVYHSNAIEGNQLSLRETEIALETLSGSSSHGKYETEALSLNKANDYLYDLISGKARLGRKSLLQLHGLIMEGSDVERGEYRIGDVTIKNSNHKPPPAASVENGVDELFKWINRSAHDYSPLVMATILHHWLTWIHPFTDGNGRTTRMFFNFYLLQKGYPMVIVKLDDRDDYYDALIEADNGNILKLLELFIKKTRQTATIYEEFINEDEREVEWKRKYQKLAEQQEEEYKKARQIYQFDYEIWKSQIEVFKVLFKETIKSVEKYLPQLNFAIEEYDLLSFNQFIDMLEGRKVTNTWHLNLTIEHPDINKKVNFVFYFERFDKQVRPIIIFGQPLKDQKGKQLVSSGGYVKLYITVREDQENIRLHEGIDLVNVGAWRDKLSFGVKNRKHTENTRGKKPQIMNVEHMPSEIIRNFVDQILKYYFTIDN